MKKVGIVILWIIFIVSISIGLLRWEAKLNIQPTIEEKFYMDIFNNVLLVISGILLIYWIVLIVKYEKEEKYEIKVDADEEEILKKYNPLIAGCIYGNRGVLFRDVLAVILNLVNIGYLKMELVPLASDGEKIINNRKEDPFKNIRGIPKEIKGYEKKKLEGTYKYFISVNEESEYKPDEIEEYIRKWIFIWAHRDSTNKYYQGELSVDLFQTFRKIVSDKNSKSILDELDYIVKQHINELGANKSIPFKLKILNLVIFIITTLMAVSNLQAVDKVLLDKIVEIVSSIFIINRLMIIILILSLISLLINYIIQKNKGKNLITMSVNIICTYVIMIILTYIFMYNKFLLVSETLIGIATLIILTDNLMIKNDKSILEDYNKLKILNKKIEEYSLLHNAEIEEVFLREKYLSYAISFGINKYSYIIDSFIVDIEANAMSLTEYY